LGGILAVRCDLRPAPTPRSAKSALRGDAGARKPSAGRKNPISYSKGNSD